MRSQNAASPSLATNPVGSDGLLVLSGYGVRVAVERRHLVIRDGFPSERRESRLSRATCGLKRLVVLGHSGTVSLEALRWIQDVGAAFVHIDADGTVVTASTAPALNDSRLRRAQALAGLDERGYAIAKELIRIKIEGQRAVLSAIDPESHEYGAIDDALRALAEAADLDSIRLFEANAAAAYWRAWSPIEVRFARNHLPRIPAHWQRFGARGSAVTGASPRRASNPANALLNYLYAILEAETRIALLTLGLVVGLTVQETTLGTTVANLGMSETTFPKPVFAGDTIHARTTVLELRESKSRPTQGIVTFEHLGLNQNDEVVCRTVRGALMMKRPQGDTA